MTQHPAQSIAASPTRIILGISGASGAIYGQRLLGWMQQLGIESHLIISKSAAITIQQELSITLDELRAKATYHYAAGDIAARISSGSFITAGMIIAPCSMKTLGEIASGVTTGLISRAADVCLKERRKLVLMTRETPLHLGHIENMAAVTRMGGIIAPPVPAFYHNPQSMDDIINHTTGRVLDLFGIAQPSLNRWDGIAAKPHALAETPNAS